MGNKQWMQTTLMIGLVSFFSSCSPIEHNKDVVPEIESLRENAILEVQKGPAKPKIVEKEVVVREEVLVYQEAAKIDDSVIIIDLDSNILEFYENQTSTFLIRVRHMVDKLSSKLDIKNLPSDANLTKVKSERENEDLYQLTWTPNANYLPSNKLYEQIKIELLAINTSKTYDIESLSTQTEALIVVFKKE